MYANRAALIGFLGQDAEVRNTRNDNRYTILSLATKRSWKDSSGEWVSRTTWHRCVVWGKLAEFAATLSKGAHVQIEGEILTREYTPKTKATKGKSAEAKKTITEVRVFTIVKLDRPAKTEGAA